MSRSNRSSLEHPVSLAEAILLAVHTPDDDSDGTRSLCELEQLLSGLGIAVTHRLIQRRASRGAPTYVGEGKLRELAALTGGTGQVPRGVEPAHPPGKRVRSRRVLVAVDDELTPTQQRTLERALDAEVIDRTAVILRVFEARAQTREAKLEIELARLVYEMPRIRDDHSLGDREGGGGVLPGATATSSWQSSGPVSESVRSRRSSKGCRP